MFDAPGIILIPGAFFDVAADVCLLKAGEDILLSLLELFIIAIGLAMDAFAVSLCKGMATGNLRLWDVLAVGVWFGGFQALMPFIGYLLGNRFLSTIAAFDHWIAFGVLGVIGIHMIRESCGEAEAMNKDFDFEAMLPLAVATSIDALAVGVSLTCLQVAIVPAVCLIGGVTFALSAAGVKVGNLFGVRYQARAELTGGIVLILMGTKILLEHTGRLTL